VAAAILLLMMLAVGGSIWKLDKTNQDINRKKSRMLQDTRSLVQKRKSVGEQVKTVSARLDRINEILESRCDINWPGLLSDIAKTRPKTVCVTSLSNRTGSQMSLKGLAVSNEDVYLFVDRLSKSEHIRSASIFETKKDKDNNGLVSYEIRCDLTTRKGV
jgi:Tfp pilus assembly protein PilN